MPEFSPDSRRIVGSLTNAEDIALVADRIITKGAVVGVGNTSVYALVGDGGHPDFGDHLFAIKHRAPTRTVGLFLGATSFVEMVDFDQVEEHVRPLLEDPDILELTMGDLAFLRVPLRRSVMLEMPDHVRRYTVSERIEGGQQVPYIQAYFSVADTLFANLERRLAKDGIVFPALSSMNYSKKPEITERDGAAAFCADHDIDLLHDAGRNPRSYGSYPIFETSPTGLHCVRTGNITRAVMDRVLAPYGSFLGMSEPHHDVPGFHALRLVDVPDIIQQDLYGADARQAILEQRLAFEHTQLDAQAS